MQTLTRRLRALLSSFAFLTLTMTVAAQSPTAVSIPGDYQSEVGCPGDWQP